jgi:hypothetical protein
MATLRLNPYFLFLLAGLLLTAAALMRPAPILVFAALAPLIAITDQAKSETAWHRLELILLALAAGFWALSRSYTHSLVATLCYAILCTLVVGLFVFTSQTLGNRAGKLVLVLLWLAAEYLFLVLPVGDGLFLADFLALQQNWTRWTSHSGYLGASLWVLVANLAAYEGLFKKGIKIFWLVAWLMLVAGPIALSYMMEADALSREAMINLYRSDQPVVGMYAQRGEWIARTCAWVSALVLLYAAVKNKTKKK